MPATARSLARTTARSTARNFVAAVLAVVALSAVAEVHAAQSTGAAHGITIAAAGFVHTATPCTMC